MSDHVRQRPFSMEASRMEIRGTTPSVSRCSTVPDSRFARQRHAFRAGEVIGGLSFLTVPVGIGHTRWATHGADQRPTLIRTPIKAAALH